MERSNNNYLNSMTKNIVIVLGALSIVFAGYYFYSQRESMVLNTQGNDVLLQNMLANTEVFIGRSQELDRINLDTSVFEDSYFRSLRSFSKPLKDTPVGRSNPFAEVSNTSLDTADSQ